MTVVKNIFNLSDKPIRLLQIFFDKLSDRYNVEILINTLKKNFWLKFLQDLVTLNIRKECQ